VPPHISLVWWTQTLIFHKKAQQIRHRYQSSITAQSEQDSSNWLSVDTAPSPHMSCPNCCRCQQQLDLKDACNSKSSTKILFQRSLLPAYPLFQLLRTLSSYTAELNTNHGDGPCPAMLYDYRWPPVKLNKLFRYFWLRCTPTNDWLPMNGSRLDL